MGLKWRKVGAEYDLWDEDKSRRVATIIPKTYKFKIAYWELVMPGHGYSKYSPLGEFVMRYDKGYKKPGKWMREIQEALEGSYT